jgi:two-component system NtrC family sensor kinase
MVIMKVLIVEDNADSRNLLVKQLGAYGHEVTAAVDGVDALEKALQSPPDILVTDILMPRMDGYKLCHEWRQNKKLKDIPFVFYTAIYTSGEDEKFALSLGANLFIRKPVEPEALARILSQSFEQAKEGLLPAVEAPLKPSLYLTEYNKRVVSKLNEKVSELEKSEEEIRYISSVLGAIRNINQLIVRERDKAKLLEGACRILHKVREYRFVWIGLIEEGHKRVIPAANAGAEESYLDNVKITWDNRPSGRRPTGMAIKTRKPDVVANIRGDTRVKSWREEALKRGYHSAAAIPIIHGDKVYGALTVYSSHPNGFNKAEVELLVEVGIDLGFALKAVQEEGKRQRAEDALRESNQRFADIADNALQWIWEVDAQGKYTYVSPVVEQILGYKPEEVIGKHFYDLFHPDDHERDKKAALAAFAKKQPFRQFLNRNLHKNGQTVWLSTSGVPIVDEAGNLLGYRGADADVTERKKAEEEIARLAKFPNENPAPVMRIAGDGTILYANKAALPLLSEWQCQVGQLLPEYWREFTLGVLRDDSRKDVEVNVGKKIFSLTFSPIAEEDYVNLYGLDITARQRAEDALRESEARYRAVIEGAHDMIQSVGLDGSIIFVNKSWLDTLGYTEVELSGLNLFDIIHPDSLEHCQELFKQVMSGNPVLNIEAAFLTKDGRKILLEGSAAPRYIGDRVVASQGVFRDVTERKRAEEKLRDEETRRHILIDQSSDGISILDEKGKIYEANQRFAEMLGYSPEEVLKLHIWDFEAQLNREQILEKIRNMGPEGDHFETRHRRKDGTVFDVEISSNSAVYQGQKLIFSVSRDITERKQAEEALRESEAFQSSLLSNSPIPINVINPDGSIRYASPALEKLTGFSSKELIGQKPPYPYWAKGDSTQNMRALRRAMRKGGDRVVELFKKKNEERFWVEITSTPVRKDGKLQYLLANWVDITERKQAEERLRDEATRHHILIDESSDGIVVLDEKGKVYEANKRFAEMLGYTPKEVLKLSVWDWEFQFPREQVAEMIRTVDEKGDHFETRHRRKDGTTYDVEISTNGVIYAGQKLIFCVCRDITARKQAEAALRQSEAKLRVILESIPQGVTVTDLDGKILEVNNAVLRLHGYSERQELIGRSAFELIAKGGHARATASLKNTLETGRSGTIEYTLIRKNGTTFPAQLSAALIQDESAKPIGFVAVTEDITERRHMQEQLAITDRLASVGELAAGIAHELNNPLTGVIGFSQLLLDKEMPDEIREDVEVVYKESQRASQVVKNLLTFARKHTAAKERVDINDVISKVLELRAYEQNLENITVDARLDSDLPQVMAGYFQLQQVFLNIVINAEYFMKEAHRKGKLTITTEKVGNKVRASFSDDGPGIAPENLGHLFDPFFTTKEVGRGTGLGLSICHGIVAEHGGRIYVESELGKGATFIVELPIGAAGKKGGAV